MVINHNMSALYSNRQLGVTNLGLTKDMEKLSSGEKINRAGDDGADHIVYTFPNGRIELDRAGTNSNGEVAYRSADGSSRVTVNQLSGLNDTTPASIYVNPQVSGNGKYEAVAVARFTSSAPSAHMRPTAWQMLRPRRVTSASINSFLR